MQNYTNVKCPFDMQEKNIKFQVPGKFLHEYARSLLTRYHLSLPPKARNIRRIQHHLCLWFGSLERQVLIYV